MMTNYVKTIIEILGRSGIVDDIYKAKSGFKVKYKNMGKYNFGSKHRNIHPKDSPSYYRFLPNYIKTILGLNGPSEGRMLLTSKYFYMDKKAVEEFKLAWEVAKSLRTT